MSTPEKSNLLTPTQLDCVLSEIATTAKAIERLSILLNHCEDGRDQEALIVSVVNMAQRIGWAADMAMTRSAESIGPCYGGDAEDWMMPPVFHENAAPLS